ncbi:MAG TPA: VWA domain-containing protein [Myxococcaceae bacterium]|nr:VWA domain-containing protein [Myxococcaceae bacterium]
MPNIPGGPIASRPLHFIFLADCSTSMQGKKIQSLNQAIREAIPHMRDVAAQNPNAQVLVRAIRFSDGAQWHLSQPTAVDTFEWTDLTASGQTSMGEALTLAAEALNLQQMGERALPPVLLLISDGQPTDAFKQGLDALLQQGWGKKSVRIAIAIGEDADLNVLRQFMGNPELEPLRANNAPDLVKYIRWASTAVLQAASAPPSQARTTANVNVPLPAPPPPGPQNANDVW